MNERMNELYLAFSAIFKVQNIGYRIQRTKTNSVKYKKKSRKCKKNAKQKHNKN